MDKRISKSKTGKAKSSIPTPSTKTTSSKSKSSKEPKKREEPKKSSKKPKEEVKIVTPEPPTVEEYADDFEEYESDFEDDVSEIKPVRKDPPKQVPKSTTPSPPPVERKAHFEEEVVQSEEDSEKESYLLNRFNQAKHSNASSNSSAPTSIIRNANDPRPTTSLNRVFRFDTRAIPNTEALMQSAKIFEQLKSEGSLSVNFIQSIDVPPNRASEIFNSLIESSTSSQRFTQTGDDCLDNFSQMTPRDHAGKANQFPAIFTKTETNTTSKPAKSFDTFSTAERFLKFAGISERTFMSLMSSNSEPESTHLPLRSNVEFSAGYVEFSLEQFAKKCKPIAVEISCEGSPKILVGFYVKESDQRLLVDKSILLEYNFSDTEQPINNYMTGDEITDFSYSTDGKSLIFAGQKSGNCLLWDLLNRRQPNENTPQLELHSKIRPQLPAYSTSYIYAERKKKAFTLQSDQSIIRTKALKSTDSSGQQQFLSLNAGGNVTIWAVTRDQFMGGNTEDLGLDFMSLVRLMKISTSTCSAIPGFGSAAQASLCMDVSNLAEFIVGLSNGTAIRVCKNRKPDSSQIRRYNLTSGITRTISIANAVCFCPQDPNYFAIGSSTGSLLIFKTSQPDPIMEIQLKESRSYRVGQLTDLVWSQSHNQILYALYDSKFFAIWDLSTLSSIEPEIVDLSQKFSSTVARMSGWGSVNRTAYVAFTLTSGSILVHEFHRVSAQNVEARKLFDS